MEASDILKKGAVLSTDSLQKKIGKKIKELREKRGLTQEELASACGWVRVSVVQLEKGIGNPPLVKIWLLCCALNCNPNDIFPTVRKTKITLSGMPSVRYPK